MAESYNLLFKEGNSLLVILPSLGLSAEELKAKIKNSKSTVCFINYSGMKNSEGFFPGKNIVQNIDSLIDSVQEKTGRKVSKIIGDSYGGLLVLGLLSKYKKKYGKVKVILTSPVISFGRLEKNPSSPQSKQGFVRYLGVAQVNRKDRQRTTLQISKSHGNTRPFQKKCTYKEFDYISLQQGRKPELFSIFRFQQIKKYKDNQT